MDIWFVDDLPENHATWLNSFPADVFQQHSLRCFDTVEALFAAVEGERSPDILFVDYFIGPRIGSEVISWFLDRPERPLLIAHSSQASANRTMLKEGADLSLEKMPGAVSTASIRRQIQSEADLTRILAYRGL
ncbi:MAG: hypothetical protein ACO1RX_18910 [Candidatus Sericytochromatia bacterium]